MHTLSISKCAADVLRDGDQLAGGVHLVALRVALRAPPGLGRQGQARLQRKSDICCPESNFNHRTRTTVQYLTSAVCDSFLFDLINAAQGVILFAVLNFDSATIRKIRYRKHYSSFEFSGSHFHIFYDYLKSFQTLHGKGGRGKKRRLAQPRGGFCGAFVVGKKGSVVGRSLVEEIKRNGADRSWFTREWPSSFWQETCKIN